MKLDRRFLLPLFLIGGCAQVDYQRPETYLPAEWPARDAGAGKRMATEIRWQDFFRDARLHSLIDLALTHNSDLKIALARITEARAQVDIVGADRLPSATLSGSYTKTLIPPQFTGTDKPVTSERAEISLTSISYELDFWGRIGSLSESAKANLLATTAGARSLRIALIAEVANQYYSLLELDERLIILRAAIVSREHNRNIVRRAMELGAAARADVLLAESQLQSLLGDLANMENQRTSTAHALRLLVGRPLDSLPAGKRLQDQEVVHDLAPGIPSDVLYARPDVIAAENRLKEANANIAAARAAFLPKILLTAGLGMASPTLAKLFLPGSNNWSFQPALSMPLFDGGRLAGFQDVAEARKVSAVADYERTVQTAFREVATLLSARTSLVAQRQSTEAVVQAYQERLTVADVRYKAGSASYIEVLDAQRDLYSAQQTAVATLRQQISTAGQLYKALGGGAI